MFQQVNEIYKNKIKINESAAVKDELNKFGDSLVNDVILIQSKKVKIPMMLCMMIIQKVK